MKMLKDDKGRSVLLRHWNAKDSGSYREALYTVDEDKLEPVDEAIVSSGDETFLHALYIQRRLDEACFGHLSWDIRESWGSLGVHISHNLKRNYGHFQGNNKPDDYFIEGKKVDKAEYDMLMDLLSEFGQYDHLLCDYGAKLRGDVVIGIQQALEMIGDGQRVTARSLTEGKAIGEVRPRLLPGDTVAVTLRGKEVIGTVAGLSKKVSVLKMDGKKGSYVYSKVKRDDSASAFTDEIVKELEPTIASNFKHVLDQEGRFYRAKVERRNATLPMFPDPEIDRHPSNVEDALSCHCPICGWIMADFHDCGTFECSFCRIQGKVLELNDDEIKLLMYRMPGKNRFAIKESRCCSNCGLFQFESGRQGKRSTGYCVFSNQCLQAYNVCDYWFPRPPGTYSSNMRQHITNLGYGVEDRRNTDRNDIRDTIYREEDHEAEKKRGERAKVVYANAYEKFMRDLAEQAKAADLYEESLEEQDVEKWKERLDDGC